MPQKMLRRREVQARICLGKIDALPVDFGRPVSPAGRAWYPRPGLAGRRGR